VGRFEVRVDYKVEVVNFQKKTQACRCSHFLKGEDNWREGEKKNYSKDEWSDNAEHHQGEEKLLVGGGLKHRKRKSSNRNEV